MKILYVDMDNVLVDFPSGIARLKDADRKTYEDRLDEVPHIFSLMDPIKGLVKVFDGLSGRMRTVVLDNIF